MTEKSKSYFIEIACFQKNKHGNIVCGDTFLSRRAKEQNRYVAVLSDGLGSGIKANVLSTITASMALNFTLRRESIQRTAEAIMKTLPIDSHRGISYATFTVLAIDNDGEVQAAEYDNPFVVLKNGKVLKLQKQAVSINNPNGGCGELLISRFQLHKNDRIVLFSDGISQSGMGNKDMPFGWGEDAICSFIENVVSESPDISAYSLARKIVLKAELNDIFRLKDDASCAVAYLRSPRKLIVCTGPPYSKDNDSRLAAMLAGYSGKKIVCGGTTAKIIARELNTDITVDLTTEDPELPPISKMDGVDLISEGILTLSKVEKLLEEGASEDSVGSGAAYDIVRLLMKSDIIDFVVGTKVNEAHQDPSLPVELEIRRNVVKRICSLLEDRYIKQVGVTFI